MKHAAHTFRRRHSHRTRSPLVVLDIARPVIHIVVRRRDMPGSGELASIFTMLTKC